MGERMTGQEFRAGHFAFAGRLEAVNNEGAFGSKDGEFAGRGTVGVTGWALGW
jgi:hypothetical protein